MMQSREELTLKIAQRQRELMNTASHAEKERIQQNIVELQAMLFMLYGTNGHGSPRPTNGAVGGVGNPPSRYAAANHLQQSRAISGIPPPPPPQAWRPTAAELGRLDAVHGRSQQQRSTAAEGLLMAHDGSRWQAPPNIEIVDASRRQSRVAPHSAVRMNSHMSSASNGTTTAPSTQQSTHTNSPILDEGDFAFLDSIDAQMKKENDDDDDLVVVMNDNEMTEAMTRCPYSTMPMTNPQMSTQCIHRMDKESYTHAMKNAKIKHGQRTNAFPCPVPGCNQLWSFKTTKKDKEFLKKIVTFRKAQGNGGTGVNNNNNNNNNNSNNNSSSNNNNNTLSGLKRKAVSAPEIIDLLSDSDDEVNNNNKTERRIPLDEAFCDTPPEEAQASAERADANRTRLRKTPPRSQENDGTGNKDSASASGGAHGTENAITSANNASGVQQVMVHTAMASVTAATPTAGAANGSSDDTLLSPPSSTTTDNAATITSHVNAPTEATSSVGRNNTGAIVDPSNNMPHGTTTTTTTTTTNSISSSSNMHTTPAPSTPASSGAFDSSTLSNSSGLAQEEDLLNANMQLKLARRNALIRKKDVEKNFTAYNRKVEQEAKKKKYTEWERLTMLNKHMAATNALIEKNCSSLQQYMEDHPAQP